MHHETNLFVIENAAELKARFRRCRVRGLNSEHPEYHRNKDRLHGLARDLKRPVTVIEERSELFLIVPADVVAIPAEYALVGCVAQLEMEDAIFELNFAAPAPEHIAIALNFIRHAAENRLIADRALWRPRAGQGFLERVPEKISDNILKYNGFRVRPMRTAEGTLALCVDATACHTMARPLPKKLDRDPFAREVKGRHCIYHFGDRWYEIVVTGLSDLTVERHTFSLNGKPRKLLEHILDEAEKPLGPELTQLRGDEAVVLYPNYQGEERAAPTSLCFPVIGSAESGRHHASTLLDPQSRRPRIAIFVANYLTGMRLDGVPVKLADRGHRHAKQIFQVPDIELGSKQRLSVRQTSGALDVDIGELGKRRSALLRDRRCGFYQNDPLDHQIFIVPRSVYDSFGHQFVKDLGNEVDSYLGKPNSYEPQVIVYNDVGKRRFALQAQTILEAVSQAKPRVGYALAMIHRPEDQKRGVEDPLAALVSQRLRDQWSLQTAVIHTDTPRRAYREVHTPSGRQYSVDPQQSRRFSGYLKNVAVNHVLLNNQRWPYVLATPLHADVVIGIDVKSNTCGLLAIGRNGRDVRFQSHTSRQKECLLEGQIATYLVDILSAEHQARRTLIESVVIHRDGRVFASELKGVAKAVTKLKRDGVLTSGAEISVLEIGKTSPAPLRLFEVTDVPDETQNPPVGAWYAVDGAEAYVCTTGKPFLRQGTARPLHIHRVYGSMPIGKLAEDVYALSTLAWTQPETCSRTPVTLRLTDRFLTGEAGEYDADAVTFYDFDEEGNAA
jgi:Piwi domain